MERFLSQCARYIYSKHGKQLKDLCLVFPNRRAGVFFTHYLQQELNDAVIGPKIITVNELFSTHTELKKGEKLQLISLLYDVFVKHTKTSETFDEFYFWGEILLADFNDIDRYMVNARDLFTNIADLKEIDNLFDYLTEDQRKAIAHFWGNMAVSDKKGFQQKYLNIWEKLYPVYDDFKKLLRERNLAYPGMMDRDVVERLKDHPVQSTFVKYYFIGLNALNECEKQFFRYLQQQDKAVFLWDYDQSYLQADQQGKVLNEAGHFMRYNLQAFPPPEDFELNTNSFSKPKNIRLVAVSSMYGQAQEIPRFLKDIKKSFESRFDNTAIVLADENLLFPALGAIPPALGKINVTMGYPVRNSMVYGFLMLLATLLRNRRFTESGQEAYHRHVTDILSHQLLNSVEPEKVGLFLEEVKAKNRISIPLEELTFSDLHRLLFELPAQVVDYSSYFKAVLLALYRHLEESRESDDMLLELIYVIYQAVEKLDQVVREVHQESNRVISDLIYFRLFSQYIGQLSVAFEGEPLSGVQVMGILETRCLDFDNLVILGLNENKWPRKFTAPSFIPFNIRVGFGLPGIDEQDAMYGYYFYRLVQRAKNISATYSVVKEAGTTGELSRYGYQLLYDSVHKPRLENLEFRFSSDPVESVAIPASKALVDDLLARNTAEHPLSPSAINTYLNCKYKFYLKYVVGLKEPDEVKEDIDGAIFGNVFHRTLEALYKPFESKVIDRVHFDKMLGDKTMLLNEITRQIAINYLKRPENNLGRIELKGKALLVRENVLFYLRRVLKIDRELAPFTVVSLEQKYKRSISLNGRELYIGGDIDRVDRVNGRLRVIDYKTGQVEKLKLSGVDALFERDAKNPPKTILQALIYVWGLSTIFPQEDITPVIYSLKSIFTNPFDGEIKLTVEKREVSFSEIKNDFERELQALVTEIYSENNVFTQTVYQDKCKYCPYADICRRVDA